MDRGCPAHVPDHPPAARAPARRRPPWVAVVVAHPGADMCRLWGQLDRRAPSLAVDRARPIARTTHATAASGVSSEVAAKPQAPSAMTRIPMPPSARSWLPRGAVAQLHVPLRHHLDPHIAPAGTTFRGAALAAAAVRAASAIASSGSAAKESSIGLMRASLVNTHGGRLPSTLRPCRHSSCCVTPSPPGRPGAGRPAAAERHGARRGRGRIGAGGTGVDRPGPCVPSPAGARDLMRCSRPRWATRPPRRTTSASTRLTPLTCWTSWGGPGRIRRVLMVGHNPGIEMLAPGCRSPRRRRTSCRW